MSTISKERIAHDLAVSFVQHQKMCEHLEQVEPRLFTDTASDFYDSYKDAYSDIIEQLDLD